MLCQETSLASTPWASAPLLSPRQLSRLSWGRVLFVFVLVVRGVFFFFFCFFVWCPMVGGGVDPEELSRSVVPSIFPPGVTLLMLLSNSPRFLKDTHFKIFSFSSAITSISTTLTKVFDLFPFSPHWIFN